MALNSVEQLAINDQAARGDWDQDRIDRATAAAVAATGAEELGHQNEQIKHYDEQADRNLGLTALKPEQDVALNELGASGVDQDRLDAVKAQMEHSNN